MTKEQVSRLKYDWESTSEECLGSISVYKARGTSKDVRMYVVNKDDGVHVSWKVNGINCCDEKSFVKAMEKVRQEEAFGRKTVLTIVFDEEKNRFSWRCEGSADKARLMDNFERQLSDVDLHIPDSIESGTRYSPKIRTALQKCLESYDESTKNDLLNIINSVVAQQ